MASVQIPTTNNLISLSPRLSFAASDRRQHHRFPITAQVEYILDGHRGSAKTVDIGSGGVLLKTGTLLEIGQKIEVLIDWPALLDERVVIRLVIFGKVLRSNEAGTAVEIRQYEFRVRAHNRFRRSPGCAGHLPPPHVTNL